MYKISVSFTVKYAGINFPVDFPRIAWLYL